MYSSNRLMVENHRRMYAVHCSSQATERQNTHTKNASLAFFIFFITCFYFLNFIYIFSPLKRSHRWFIQHYTPIIPSQLALSFLELIGLPGTSGVYLVWPPAQASAVKCYQVTSAFVQPLAKLLVTDLMVLCAVIMPVSGISIAVNGGHCLLSFVCDPLRRTCLPLLFNPHWGEEEGLPSHPSTAFLLEPRQTRFPQPLHVHPML